MFQVSPPREPAVSRLRSCAINIVDTCLKITSKSTGFWQPAARWGFALKHSKSRLTHSVLKWRHHFHAFSGHPQLVGVDVVGGAALLAFVAVRLHGCAAIFSVQGHAYHRGEIRLSQTKSKQIRTTTSHRSHPIIRLNLSNTTAVRMMYCFASW